jgi:hypothetical protein
VRRLRLRPPYDRAAYWRTVGRFALYGPLVGGAPYAWVLFTLPFIYLIGFVPALLAGLLYAAWQHAPGLRAPNLAWRAVMGFVCGAAGSAAASFAGMALLQMPLLFTLGLLAVHGVPAALLLASTHRDQPARRGVL